MLSVNAMSGFGAGSAAVGFPSITGERFRYRADLGITKDGSNYVSAWADQSGNDDHLADAGDSPLWVDNLVNGHPAVRFDGVDDVMQVSATASGGVRAHIFLVVNQVSWTIYETLIEWGKAGYSFNIIQVPSTPRICGAGNAGGSPNDLAPPALGTFFLVYAFFDGTTGSYTALNNDSPVTGEDPGAMSDFTHFTIGGAKLLSWDCNIEVAEAVCYDGVEVSGSDLVALKAYFNNRYALY